MGAQEQEEALPDDAGQEAGEDQAITHPQNKSRCSMQHTAYSIQHTYIRKTCLCSSLLSALPAASGAACAARPRALCTCALCLGHTKIKNAHCNCNCLKQCFSTGL